MKKQLNCVHATNQILNQSSELVKNEDIASEQIQGLIDRMIELSQGKGEGDDSRQMVGLAAIQLGEKKRILTIDVSADGSNKKQTLVPFINPVITDVSETMVDGREGCWSCANICGNVSRHESVKLSGLDRNSSNISMELNGFVARIAQHEVDHLNGIRFPDRIPADEPQRLHTVEPTEFEDYRSHWQNWSALCDRQEWEKLKAGDSKMDGLSNEAQKWLVKHTGSKVRLTKHPHSHQDEVYLVSSGDTELYLKVAQSLKDEHDNLVRLEKVLNTPKVVDFFSSENKNYLLITKVPGKNLVELIGEWPDEKIVKTFARAVKGLHSIDAKGVFIEASSSDVLIHGDMALPNIIISESGSIGYIDFGQLSFGSPELDIYDSIWSLQRNLGPSYGELFIEKYGSVLRTPKIEKILKFKYKAP